MLRKLIFTLIFLFPISAFAQDRVIFTVGVGADEISYVFDTRYETVAKIVGNVKVTGNKARLGGKFVFDRLYESKRYTAGPELSYKFGYIEPYGHILIGKEYLNSSPISDFVRTVGAGVRINSGFLTIVPFQIDSTRGLKEPLGSPGVTQFSAHIGFRFGK